VEALSLAPQATAPFVGLYNTRNAHGEEAFVALRDFAEQNRGHAYHLHMCGSRGSGTDMTSSSFGGPPLSWALSKTAREEIAGYLKRCNATVYKEIRDAVTPPE
jgi:hypothetical protein